MTTLHLPSRLTGNNRMSDIKSLLSKTELRVLLGGWRRHLNPFHNPKAAIKAATKHDPILRKKAFWSIRKHGTRIVKNVGLLTSTSSIILISLIMMYLSKLYGNYFMIPYFIAAMVGIYFDAFQRERIIKGIEEPLFLSDGRSTGHPELDIILSPDPFEVEAILADGGLQANEIKKLAGFIEILKQRKQSECQLAEGLVTVKTTVDISPKAWDLVKRATEIISRKSVPQSLVSESPVIHMFSAMEYAGIDIHTKSEGSEYRS